MERAQGHKDLTDVRPGPRAGSRVGPSRVPPAVLDRRAGLRPSSRNMARMTGQALVPESGSAGSPDSLIPTTRGGVRAGALASQLLTHMVTMTTKAKRQGPIMFQAPLRSSCKDMAKISVPRRNRTWARHRGDHRVTGSLSQSFTTTRSSRNG